MEDRSSGQQNPKLCVSACPSNSFSIGDNICRPCDESCQTCSGPTNLYCNTCAEGMKEDRANSINGQKHCVDTCPSGFYQNQESICLPCHQNCETCSGPKSYNCNTCAQGMKEDRGSTQKDPKHCVDTCPSGFYSNDESICMPCHQNCETCSGPNSYNCNTCAQGMKEYRGSTQKDPKHCVDTCSSETYSFLDIICLPCHENCETCSGPNSYNCNTCIKGMKEDRVSTFKSPQHCVQACPFGSSQIQGNICIPRSNNLYYLIAFMSFSILLPLTISLCRKTLKTSNKKNQDELQEQQQENIQPEDNIDLSNLYYYNKELNKSKSSEFFLCLLASSDLTFPSLNQDLFILRNTVVAINMARSILFVLSNILIYRYQSTTISYFNILTILIHAPLPFIYKCITPRIHSNRRLVSKVFKHQIQIVRKGDYYTELNLSRKSLRISIIVIAILMTIGLAFLVPLLEQPDLNWIIILALIQLGSYFVWSLFWGLVCYIKKKNNEGASISKIPDWRVEMVFQDLLMMKILSIGNSKNQAEGLQLQVFDE